MYHALLVMFLLVAIILVALILLQQGKNANMGTYLSSAPAGVTNSSSNLITRIIVVLAMLFFIISLILCNMSSNDNGKSSKWDKLSQSQQEDKMLTETLSE